MLTTSPLTFEPTGYRASMLCHGEADFCFRPSATFSFSRSIERILTWTFWSMETTSLGWPTRPQAMSVMCSRPSMPPRSTNAPKSAMFLTTPSRIWPTPHLREEPLLGVLALFLDQAPARDDDVAPVGVDLQDLAGDFLPDVRRHVGRTPDVHLAGRQEHRHADVHQQAALDLAADAALDHVALVVLRQDAFPALDPVGLALRQDHQARLVLHGLQQDVDRLAHLHIGPVELLEGHAAFALKAHVNDGLAAHDADDVAGHHAAALERLHRLFVEVLQSVLLPSPLPGRPPLPGQSRRRPARIHGRSCSSP